MNEEVHDTRSRRRRIVRLLAYGALRAARRPSEEQESSSGVGTCGQVPPPATRTATADSTEPDKDNSNKEFWK